MGTHHEPLQQDIGPPVLPAAHFLHNRLNGPALDLVKGHVPCGIGRCQTAFLALPSALMHGPSEYCSTTAGDNRPRACR
ncbi:hypothetical protein SAMN06272735_9134 [Streptomyces sp. TLI_55]|nr:hypothetical protein SAMN06272735_9134 [Streptomyces sp. TLI_55]